MFLFPILERKSQILLKVLWILTAVSFVGFLFVASAAERLSWSAYTIYYWFSGFLLFLVLALIAGRSHKVVEPAGMLGFHHQDVFIKNQNLEKKIPGEEIKELVFYPEQFEEAQRLNSIPKRIFEWMMAKPSSPKGSRLEIKTRDEKFHFLVCFERVSHQNLFLASLEEHPKAKVENKKI